MLSGSAGVIQVALNLFEMTKDQDYLDLADMYSKHLVENVSILESGVAWKNKHTNSYLGGFSHGTSGIAWSLWRSGIMNRNQEYIDLAKKHLLMIDHCLKKKKVRGKTQERVRRSAYINGATVPLE